jgi:hypothetical protein
MPAPGWICLYRSLLDHEMWTRARFTHGQAWVDLILSAAFEDHEAFVIHGPTWVKRGQVLTTQMALAQRWQWNRETVRLFLRELERHLMVAIETSKASATGYTLISILNYEKYQGGTDDDSAIASAIAPAIQSAIGQPSASHVIRRIRRERRTTSTGESRRAVTANLEKASPTAWPSPTALAAMWNELAPAECPRVRQITPGRIQAADAALAANQAEDYWRSTIAEIRHSTFLRGLRATADHKHWKADFDWFLRSKDKTPNHVRVAEGVFRDSSAAEDDE